MLQEKLAASDEVNVAEAIPPPAPAVASSAKPEVWRPYSEFTAGVRRALLLSWGLFTLVVVAAFSGSLEVVLVLGVVVMLAAVLFIVPTLLTRNKATRRETPNNVDTPNGRMTQREAMIQVIMVPLILSAGMAAIGYFATHQ